MMMRSSVLTLAILVAAECHAQLPNWTQIQPSKSPAARTRHAMAYDLTRQVTVLFGGEDASTPAKRFGDTWEYDGTTWTEILPTVSPPARSGHAMIYDPLRQMTVLYGGNGLRDTWTWNGKVWTKIKIPSAQKPSARTGFAMAYDLGRARTVLFGGFITGVTGGSKRGRANDTWEFDGIVWTHRSIPILPPVRNDHAMAYDSARNYVVMFGGEGKSGHLSDTWEWNGAVWQQTMPATTAPTARRVHEGLTYDSARGRTVMFGGWTNQFSADTWEYDGKDWTQITTASVPPGRGYQSMAFDSARGRVVMFGGSSIGVLHGDTWEYEGGVGCSMTADVPTVSIVTGGAQTLTLNAGSAHANRPYWIFGSITGTSPGISLNGIQIPLNVDVYTQLAMENVTANPPFKGFRSVLDASGGATAQFIVPANMVKASFTLYHAYVVFDAGGTFHCASNAVSVTLQ